MKEKGKIVDNENLVAALKQKIKRYEDEEDIVAALKEKIKIYEETF